MTDEIFVYLKECVTNDTKCRLNIVFLCIRLSVSQELIHAGSHLTRKLLIFMSQQLTSLEKRSVLLEYAHLISRLIPQDFFCGPISILRSTKHIETISSTHCFIPFKCSPLWKLQNAFYSRQNLIAWNVVPFQISSNRFVARLYVDRIRQAWDAIHPEMINQIKPSIAVTVVEVGAGHGMLSYLIAKEIQRVCLICFTVFVVCFEYILM